MASRCTQGLGGKNDGAGRRSPVPDPYRRPWRDLLEHYGSWKTCEAIAGAVTRSLPHPRTLLLLGRYATEGSFQYVGRTTALSSTAGTAVAGLLAAGLCGHPYTGWSFSSFSAGWGSREQLDVTLMQPELVVEVGVDVARDASGRWRHQRAGTAPAPTSPPPTFPTWQRDVRFDVSRAVFEQFGERGARGGARATHRPGDRRNLCLESRGGLREPPALTQPLADGAYLKCGMVTPHRKRFRRDLLPGEEDDNAAHHKVGARAEHVIGRMKLQDSPRLPATQRRPPPRRPGPCPHAQPCPRIMARELRPAQSRPCTTPF